MTFKHTYILTSLASVAMAAFTAIAPPPHPDYYQINPSFDLTSAPVQSYHQDESTRLAMAERRRWLYEARTNTLISSYLVATARQEIPSGLTLG